MVEWDEAKGVFRVVYRRMVNGNRINKTKTLPPGSTREQAERYEARMLDPDYDLKQRVIRAIESADEEHGHIYAIRNEYLPGIVKIGTTRGIVRSRIQTLSTSMPADFELIQEIYVRHAFALEQSLHAHFSEFRVNRNREFFKMPEDVIKHALNVVYEIDGFDVMRNALNLIGKSTASPLPTHEPTT